MTYIVQSDDTIGGSRSRQTSALGKGKVLVGEAIGSVGLLVRSTGQEVQLLGASNANGEGYGALIQSLDLSGILERHNLAGQVVVAEDVATSNIVIVERGGHDGQCASVGSHHDVVALALLLLRGWSSLVNTVAAVASIGTVGIVDTTGVVHAVVAVDTVGDVDGSVVLDILGSHILTRACHIVVHRSRSLHSARVGTHDGHRVVGQISVLFASVVSVLRVGSELLVLSFGFGVCERLLQDLHSFVTVRVDVLHLFLITVGVLER